MFQMPYYNLSMNIYFGCPIWSYKDWIGSFYPQKTKPADFLREYARRLTTIEGNTTFYAVPAQKTLQQWVAETPETFRFCPKLPRAISHAGKLAGHIEEANRFVQVMSQLGKRLGPMFLQLPPHYSPLHSNDLQTFLQAWPGKVRLGVEVRHLDWFEPPHNESLNRLLTSCNMARVIIDTRPIRSLEGDPVLEDSTYQRLLQAQERKPNVPILPERTTDFVFLRYIGHPQLELNTPFIEEWGDRLTAWLREKTDAYVFCHCPDERISPWLCRRFHQRIVQSLPIPSLPWDEANPDTFEQAHLF